jgi:hypothetical protein
MTLVRNVASNYPLDSQAERFISINVFPFVTYSAVDPAVDSAVDTAVDSAVDSAV